jgi:hypothetical protein
VVVHQDEGYTIRKADLLICVLPEKSKSGKLDTAGRTKNFEPWRGIEKSCDLVCELIPAPARDEGDSLLYYKATGEAADIVPLDLLPDR